MCDALGQAFGSSGRCRKSVPARTRRSSCLTNGTALTPASRSARRAPHLIIDLRRQQRALAPAAQFAERVNQRDERRSINLNRRIARRAKEMSSNASVSPSRHVGEGSGVQFKPSSKQRPTLRDDSQFGREIARDDLRPFSIVSRWLRRLKKLAVRVPDVQVMRLESSLTEWPSVECCNAEVKDSGVPEKLSRR